MNSPNPFTILAGNVIALIIYALIVGTVLLFSNDGKNMPSHKATHVINECPFIDVLELKVATDDN